MTRITRHGPAIRPLRLSRCGLEHRWIGLRNFASFPNGGALQRFDSPSFIEVEDRIELIRELRVKVMALTFGSGLINHPNRSLES